jgi:hypothetical protein
MMDANTARAWMDDLRLSRAMWQEPDGFLVVTEPDADERARVRERLTIAIDVLGRALSYGDPS